MDSLNLFLLKFFLLLLPSLELLGSHLGGVDIRGTHCCFWRRKQFDHASIQSGLTVPIKESYIIGATRRPRYGGRKEGTTQIRLDFVTHLDWHGKGPVGCQHWCGTDVTLLLLLLLTPAKDHSLSFCLLSLI